MKTALLVNFEITVSTKYLSLATCYCPTQPLCGSSCNVPPQSCVTKELVCQSALLHVQELADMCFIIIVCIEVVVFAVFFGLQDITGRLFTNNRFVVLYHDKSLQQAKWTTDVVHFSWVL